MPRLKDIRPALEGEWPIPGWVGLDVSQDIPSAQQAHMD